ncbi:MAG TPA: VIT domain-containing protein [Tepidisphaeraceae bacterium]|nr:VIT domain-containing protein [Tepidisphaeraceae bacterium]
MLRRTASLAWLAFLCLACVAQLARGDGLIIIDRPPHPLPGHFPFAPMEVSYHRVSVSIDDQVATTSVDQEFRNTSGARLEGTYMFPLPDGAAIDKFSMDIDGKEMEAELLPADKARAIYEDIVRRHKDPALLEYVGKGAFKVRIFPIEPNSTKRVRLKYTQLLKSDGGLVEYIYPLNTEKFSSRPLKDVSVKVELTCKRAIKSLYSPSHSIEIRRNGEHRATVGYEERNARPDTDFKLIFSRTNDPVGLDLLTYRTSPDEGYFLLLASPGTDDAGGRIQNRDICFVLDTSGSMAGAKMEQAKKALTFCLANLNGGDRFEIVRFSTEAEPLFNGLKEASRENIDRAQEFVQSLKPIGGTAIDDALGTARRIGNERDGGGDARPYVIIFLTDGQPTIGETNEDAIVSAQTKSQRTSPRIFSFGIGTDVNTHLLDRIANETRAFSQYVLPAEDIEVKVSSFYTKIKSPVLSGLEFYVGNREDRPNKPSISQVYPPHLPDLYAGQTLLIFGRYSGAGESNVMLRGISDGKVTHFKASVHFPETDRANPFIPRLWATRRVGWLLDEIRLRGESKELKDEVVQLAREHGIVTPYTAYLILEDEARRNVPMAHRSFRELESDAASLHTVRQQFDSASASSPGLQRSGDMAVANSGSVNSLKTSVNEQQAQQRLALEKSSPALSGTPATSQPELGYRAPRQNYAQQVRVARGKAFYQNGNTWSDAEIAKRQNLNQKQVAFNSDDYFALLRSHPDAASWLSLGNEVDVVIGDTLYQIR